MIYMMTTEPKSRITLLPSWLPELFISGCSFRAWIRSWVCHKNFLFNNSNIFSKLFTWSTSTSLSSSTLRMTNDKHQWQQAKKLVHCFRTNIHFNNSNSYIHLWQRLNSIMCAKMELRWAWRPSKTIWGMIFCHGFHRKERDDSWEMLKI